MASLAVTKRQREKLDEAERIEEYVLDRRVKSMGQGSSGVRDALENLANTKAKLKKFEDAKQLYRDLLCRTEEEHGQEHPATIRIKISLGIVLSDKGEVEPAERLLREVVAEVNGRGASRYAYGTPLPWPIFD
jgi:hypothetical protein